MDENKGFSLVELIIVISIMAILASALAPSLIKYINKARLARDIDSGRELAHAIMSALTDDAAFEGAEAHSSPQAVDAMDNAVFKAEVFQIMGVSQMNSHAKKDVNGDSFPTNTFYYTLDPIKNQVAIYYGDSRGLPDYMIYPNLGSKLSK